MCLLSNNSLLHFIDGQDIQSLKASQVKPYCLIFLHNANLPKIISNIMEKSGFFNQNNQNSVQASMVDQAAPMVAQAAPIVAQAQPMAGIYGAAGGYGGLPVHNLPYASTTGSVGQASQVGHGQSQSAPGFMAQMQNLWSYTTGSAISRW
jgi:hypothetical protein